MRTSMALLAALATGCAGSRTPTPVSATTADITADDLRHRLFIIAHDSMQGRETGSAGDYQAQEYIASEFRRLGLEPAGENGTYFQTVPFWRVAIDPQSTLNVDANALKVFVDFIPTSSGAAPLQLGPTAAIYCGSLADTAALLKPSDVAGQVVVVDVPSGTTRMAGLVAARYREAALRIRVQLDLVAPEQMARLRDGRRGRASP